MERDFGASQSFNVNPLRAMRNPTPSQMAERKRSTIRFGRTEDAYDGFGDFLKNVIAEHEFTRILDVGGGAQPMFSVPYIQERKIDYTVLDISAEELALAPKEHKKLVMDISESGAVFDEQYDFVFSRFMAEHVKDASRLHCNIFNGLLPGGMAVHFFPTVFAIPFVVNWLLPEWLAILLLPKARRERGKFAAYYKWCVGPSRRAIERYERLGYEVIEYSGFFGHGYYDSIPLLRGLHSKVRGILLRRPIAAFTSFAWVVLRKPILAPESAE